MTFDINKPRRGRTKDQPAWLTHKLVLATLAYDPDTGEFTWRKCGRRGLVGRRAGHPSGVRGYRDISICRHRIKEHRLAWFYVYGTWPSGYVDHANGIVTDNRIANLRDATFSQNASHQLHLRRDNTSGITGVRFCKKVHRWRAEIGVSGRMLWLGYFDSIEEAAIVRRNAAAKYHGDFMGVSDAT